MIQQRRPEWFESEFAAFHIQFESSSSTVTPYPTWLPQGSMLSPLSPLLFTSYVAPIDHLIDSFDIGYD